MKKELVQIIYLNGPSSSGKTTLAKALQHAFEEPFLHIGIDKIIAWMPEKINDWTGGDAPLGYSWKKSVDGSGNPIQELQVGPYAQKISKTFQEVVLTLARMGHHIVIDDISFGKQQLDEWKKILKDFRVLWIGVNAPLPILEQREKERVNRISGSARAQFHKVHVDTTYDLEIDTHQACVSENAEKIKSLASSPPNPIAQKMKKFSQDSYRLEHYSTIHKEYEEVLYQGISEGAFLAKGLFAIYPFSIFIKDQKGTIVGGVTGTLFYGSLYLDSLWIDKTLRQQGWGTKLMNEAEGIGRKHAATFVTLNTMDWEALLFYQKLGYSIEFIREGYEKNSKMYMLRKTL